MPRPRTPALVAALFCGQLASASLANVYRRIPDEAQPPLYTSNVTPYLAPGGEMFVVHDGPWAAIAFVRPTELIPPDHDLLGIDPGAIGTPMLVDGFGIFATAEDRVPLMTEVHGLGAVPVWFVDREELRAALADETLTFAELSALPSLLKGAAGFYQEQNHYADHRVSHLAVDARGTLDDGRSFSLQAVEVQLQLIYASIEFR
jgi:hypothetical protein